MLAFGGPATRNHEVVAASAAIRPRIMTFHLGLRGCPLGSACSVWPHAPACYGRTDAALRLLGGVVFSVRWSLLWLWPQFRTRFLMSLSLGGLGAPWPDDEGCCVDPDYEPSKSPVGL